MRTITIILISINFSLAQNLVPNSSFEDVAFDYCGYFPTTEKFESAIMHWLTPTHSRPIILSKKLNNDCWSYSDISPKNGNRMASLCFFSPNNNYRSYLQVELLKPLVVGKTYYVEIWIRNSRQSQPLCNNIGMYFSDTLIRDSTIFNLSFVPQVNFLEVVNASSWVCLQASFKVNSRAKYLLMGNFFTKENTLINKAMESSFSDEAIFYYLDDIYVGDEPQN